MHDIPMNEIPGKVTKSKFKQKRFSLAQMTTLPMRTMLIDDFAVEMGLGSWCCHCDEMTQIHLAFVSGELVMF